MRRPGPTAVVAGVLVAVPLLVAFLGPLVPTPAHPFSLPSRTDQGGPFGTDVYGRDVLRQVLDGGRLAILVALGATVATQVLGIGLGLVAGLTRRAWLDEVIMRPWDVVLSLPTLLVVLVAATGSGGAMLWVCSAIVVLCAAECVRMTRAVTRTVASGPAVEAMRLGGESWCRIVTHAVLPATWRVQLAAACLQLSGALGLVATTSFLGALSDPQSVDWSLMIVENKDAMSLQPWPVALPCALLASFVVGINLLAAQVSDPARGGTDPLALVEEESR